MARLPWEDSTLDRRMSFLLACADSHLELPDAGARFESDAPPWMNAACAATLYREAGAVAAIKGSYREAAHLWANAGNILAEIGLFSGFILLQMSQVNPWWEQRVDEFNHLVDSLFERNVLEGIGNEALGVREPSGHPFWRDSLYSTHQLLHLFQAMQTRTRDWDPSEMVRGAVEEIMASSPVVSVGVTETPLPAYLRLLEYARSGRYDRAASETLRNMVFRRADLLEAASMDAYHWERLTSPDAVLDFDLMAVCWVALLRRQLRGEEAQDNNDVVGVLAELAPRDSLVMLPLRVAEGLVSSLHADPGANGLVNM